MENNNYYHVEQNSGFFDDLQQIINHINVSKEPKYDDACEKVGDYIKTEELLLMLNNAIKRGYKLVKY